MTIRKTTIAIVVLAAALMLALTGCMSSVGYRSTATEDYSGFAKCLNAAGLKMYGAGWCGHCNNVKQNFGDAFQYMDYQECDARFGGDPQACQDAGVQAYPAFDFGDGVLQYGEIEFSVMAQKTGCDLQE